MKRKWLAVGISTVSVILLILTSLTNVVGYQSVQSSHQQIIKEEVNQKEFLFQTIVDIANNKEIQRIILKSQIGSGIFPTSEFPVVTKNQLKLMYFLGLILSKVVSKSRMQSMIEKYEFNDQEMQQEITAIIEKDTKLSGEISQLSSLSNQYERLDLSSFLNFVFCCVIVSIFVFLISISGVLFIPSYISYIIVSFLYASNNDNFFLYILQEGCMKWVFIWSGIFIESLLLLLYLLSSLSYNL
jgi:hypothetical protein